MLAWNDEAYHDVCREFSEVEASEEGLRVSCGKEGEL